MPADVAGVAFVEGGGGGGNKLKKLKAEHGLRAPPLLNNMFCTPTGICVGGSNCTSVCPNNAELLTATAGVNALTLTVSVFCTQASRQEVNRGKHGFGEFDKQHEYMFRKSKRRQSGKVVVAVLGEEIRGE